MKEKNTIFYIWGAALVLPLMILAWRSDLFRLPCGAEKGTALYLLLMTAVLGFLAALTGREDWICGRPAGRTPAERNGEAGVLKSTLRKIPDFPVFAVASALYAWYCFSPNSLLAGFRPSWMSEKIADALVAGALFCAAAGMVGKSADRPGEGFGKSADRPGEAFGKSADRPEEGFGKSTDRSGEAS